MQRLLLWSNDRVLLPEKSLNLKEKIRAHGLEIFDPDVSMITPGGGGSTLYVSGFEAGSGLIWF